MLIHISTISCWIAQASFLIGRAPIICVMSAMYYPLVGATRRNIGTEKHHQGVRGAWISSLDHSKLSENEQETVCVEAKAAAVYARFYPSRPGRRRSASSG